MEKRGKSIMIVNLWHGFNMKHLGDKNIALTLQNYELSYDQVFYLNLVGNSFDSKMFSKTKFISSSTGYNKIDFLLAPFKVLYFVLKINPKTIISYEQVWFWYLMLFIKGFKAKKIIIPMTLPEKMYELTKSSLTKRIPIKYERVLINWSYKTANNLVTSKNLGDYYKELEKNKIGKKKLFLVNALPETIVFPSFFNGISKLKKGILLNHDNVLKLCYVGRIHKDKQIDDLVYVMRNLKDRHIPAKLFIYGDGNYKDELSNLIAVNDLDNDIILKGFVENGDLPQILNDMGLFISPLTGNSLREVGMMGMPIVAYDTDWVHGFFEHKKDLLLVEKNNIMDFVDCIELIINDKNLYDTLSKNIKIKAFKFWGKEAIWEEQLYFDQDYR